MYTHTKYGYCRKFKTTLGISELAIHLDPANVNIRIMDGDGSKAKPCETCWYRMIGKKPKHIRSVIYAHNKIGNMQNRREKNRIKRCADNGIEKHNRMNK